MGRRSYVCPSRALGNWLAFTTGCGILRSLAFRRSLELGLGKLRQATSLLGHTAQSQKQLPFSERPRFLGAVLKWRLDLQCGSHSPGTVRDDAACPPSPTRDPELYRASKDHCVIKGMWRKLKACGDLILFFYFFGGVGGRRPKDC